MRHQEKLTIVGLGFMQPYENAGQLWISASLISVTLAFLARLHLPDPYRTTQKQLGGCVTSYPKVLRYVIRCSIKGCA